jgi:hypothetical protein
MLFGICTHPTSGDEQGSENRPNLAMANYQEEEEEAREDDDDDDDVLPPKQFYR